MLNNSKKKRVARTSRIPILYLLVFMMMTACMSPNDTASLEEMRTIPTLVIHGGAGSISRENHSPELEAQIRSEMEAALQAGYRVLAEGGTCTEAVINSIRVLELSLLFNAGKGAVFTYEGRIELDASIMEGKSGGAGAVAGVSRIKSPIEAAYAVMTKSPHVLLTGKGAEEFAMHQGLEMVDPAFFYTEQRYQQFLKSHKQEEADKMQGERKPGEARFSDSFKLGTVGAVALDQEGNLAAGTSTGGMTNKRYGRIGDSPIIGAGTYADNATCAVSATGHGEFFIRNVVAYDIAARMKYLGCELDTAASGVISELAEKKGSGGVICLDRKGNISMPFNTPGMYRGYIRENENAQILLFDTEDVKN